MWLTCDCNFFVKLISLFILIFAIVVNGIGNFLGIGDLIETEPHSCYTTTVTEESTTAPYTTEPMTEEPTSTEPHATVVPTTEKTTLAPTTEQVKTTASAPSSTVIQSTEIQTTEQLTTTVPTTVVPTIPGPTFGPPVIIKPTTTQAPAVTEEPTTQPPLTTEAPATQTTTQVPTTAEPTTQQPTTEPEKIYVIPQPQVTVFDDICSILVIPPVVDGCDDITLAIEPEAQYVDMGGGMQGFVGVTPGETYSITVRGTVNGVDESSKPVVVTVYDPVTPAAPVIKSVTYNSITVEYDERCEYRIFDENRGCVGDWSDSVHFENLEPDTNHSIEVRYKTTDIHANTNEDANKATAYVRTLSAPTTTAAPTTAAPTTTKPRTTRPSTTKRPAVSTTKAPTTEKGPYVNTASEIALAVFGGSHREIKDKGDVIGYSSTVINNMAEISDGSYVVCGTTPSLDGDFESYGGSAGNWLAPVSFVAKFSRAGTVEWIKLYGDPKYTVSLNDIAVLGNGNIVTVGTYTQSSVYGQKGGNDAVIITLSPQGKELSRNIHRGTGDDFFYCVSATADGYAVGGKTTSTDGAFLGVPGMSAIVINFNSNNEVLWKHYFNGSKSSSISGIDVDKDGNIFLACVTTATDGMFEAFDGLFGSYSDTVIMKFNYAGDYQWHYVIATSGSDEFDSIAADGKGGCLVAGNYVLNSAASPDGTLKGIHNCGDTDALAIRLNKNGGRQWYSIISGFKDDYITDVVKTDGGFAVTGYTTSSNREFASIGNKGGTDGFVCFLDVNGTIVETLSQAGFGDDAALCLAYSSDNRELLVAGRTISTDGSFKDINIYNDTRCFVGRYKISLRNY
ncbi:MAG: hypothetical protein IKW12_03250 [Clostridia bacterium]|nr:hypothetical protein [Clostridia bacterium]